MSRLARTWARTDKPSIFWISVLGGLSLFDLWAHKTRPEWTLSWTGRRWTRMEEHVAGELALLGFWCALTRWFIPHMCRPARAKRLARRLAAAVLTDPAAPK